MSWFEFRGGKERFLCASHLPAVVWKYLCWSACTPVWAKVTMWHCGASSGFFFSSLFSHTEILVWILGPNYDLEDLVTILTYRLLRGFLFSLFLFPGILLPCNIPEWMSLHTQRHNHFNIIESWKDLVGRDFWRVQRSDFFSCSESSPAPGWVTVLAFIQPGVHHPPKSSEPFSVVSQSVLLHGAVSSQLQNLGLLLVEFLEGFYWPNPPVLQDSPGSELWHSASEFFPFPGSQVICPDCHGFA